MPSSITVLGTLQIVQGNLRFLSQPTSYNPVMSGSNGPTPGAVKVSTAGTDINLAELTAMGGLGFVTNIDSANFVTIGLRDTLTDEFYPFTELLPGEFYICRLSRKLPKSEAGTGTFSGTNVVLHAKADTAPVVVVFQYFDP